MRPEIRLTTIDLDDEQQEDEAGKSPQSDRPTSVPKEMWDAIPSDLRREATDRAAWICLRKHINTPNAIQLALAGMDADMQQLEVEPPWSVVTQLMPLAPVPRRDRNGHITPDILDAASSIENDARWAYRDGKVGVAPDPDRRRQGDIASNRTRIMMERVFELVQLYGPIEHLPQ